MTKTIRELFWIKNVDYTVEVISQVWDRQNKSWRCKLSYQAPFLWHFTVRLRGLTA